MGDGEFFLEWEMGDPIRDTLDVRRERKAVRCELALIVLRTLMWMWTWPLNQFCNTHYKRTADITTERQGKAYPMGEGNSDTVFARRR